MTKQEKIKCISEFIIDNQTKLNGIDTNISNILLNYYNVARAQMIDDINKLIDDTNIKAYEIYYVVVVKRATEMYFEDNPHLLEKYITKAISYKFGI